MMLYESAGWVVGGGWGLVICIARQKPGFSQKPGFLSVSGGDRLHQPFSYNSSNVLDKFSWRLNN